MPKGKTKTSLRINILKPQGNPEQIYSKVSHWLLSTGRYIIILVEIIVLGAFVSRFKLDSDLQSNKEAIEQQIPYIKSLSADEQLIKQAQGQLSAIREKRQNPLDYSLILQKIASQAPIGVKLLTLNLEGSSGKLQIKMSGQSQTNNDLSVFIAGLKQDNTFSEVTLSSIGLDQNVVSFSVTASALTQGSKL